MILFDIFKFLSRPFYGHNLGAIKPLSKLFNWLYDTLKPKGLSIIDVQNWKMSVNMSDVSLSRDLALRGVWEPGVTKLLRNIVKPGMVAIDVGANIGYFSILLSGLVGDTGKVYVFEPEPRNFELLLGNLKLNNCINVVAYQKAVSNFHGSAFLLLHKFGWGGHKLIKTNSSKSVPVETIRLDDMLIGYKVDVVKIDVEGSELKVLESMYQIIKNNPNIKIVFEFWPKGIEELGDLSSKLRTICEEIDFSLFKIDENTGCLREVKNFDNLPTSATRDSVNLLICASNGQ